MLLHLTGWRGAAHRAPMPAQGGRGQAPEPPHGLQDELAGKLHELVAAAVLSYCVLIEEGLSLT